MQQEKNGKQIYRAPRKKNSAKREAFEWLRALAIALVITILITQVLIINAQVPSSSMEATINKNDRLLGLRFSYWFTDPQRGDVVIFYNPDNEDELYVKRVIGLPGDEVNIVDGTVYVNGQLLEGESTYLYETSYGSFGPYQVPEECYFMLGDNRNNSLDSRYWANTFVQRNKIVGKAFFRIFPNPKFIV